MPQKPTPKTQNQLRRENADLRARLDEAEETLRAIRAGEVDALVVSTEQGERIFTLKGAEHPYRVLIEDMNEGALTLTLEGVILYCNRCFAAMLKTPLEQVIGSSIHTWIAPADRRAFQALLRRNGKQSRRGEITLRASDGTLVPGYLSVNVVQMEDVQAFFCLGATDLTEQKRSEQIVAAEKLARSILDQAAEAIVVCDESARIIRASETAHTLCGNNPLGQLFGEAFSLSLTDGQPFSLTAALRGERAQGIEARLERKGQVFHLLISAGSLIGAQNESLGCVITLTDITARKRAEETAAHRLAELEAVNRISTALRTAQTLDEMLPRLLDETLAMLNTDAGIIYLYDASRDEIRKAVARGWFTRISDAPMRASEGIAGIVIATNQPYLSREFSSDPRLRESLRDLVPDGWGGAAIPIRAVQEIVGVMFVSAPLPRELSANEAHLLTTIAEIAGNAIQRTRLHEQTARRLEHVQALHAIDMAISSSFDLRLTLNILLEHVAAQLHVDAAAVLLLNPHLQTLGFAAGRGFRGSSITRLSLRLGEGYAGQAALERRIVAISDFGIRNSEAPQSAIRNLQSEMFVAYYGVPLIAKGQVKGVLEIFHRAPLHPDEEWLEFLETLAGQAAVTIDNAELFTDLQRSNMELALAYDATIEGWSRALDLRDKETEGHTQRVTEMAERLARALGMSEEELVHMRRGALLHDIGKMGISDTILLKPGSLTDEEWETMRQHPEYAYNLLSPISYLRPALDIPYCHHEKWDGTGYPRGLKGEEIPLAARIFAVVDVWDALRSDRPYRKAWSEEKARAYIREQAGKYFDPRVVEVFLK